MQNALDIDEFGNMQEAAPITLPNIYGEE